MSDSILKLSGVEKTFSNGTESLTIFRDVSFSVAKGSVVIITGESGSGKSTLLNLIGGLDYPTQGAIEAKGYRVSDLSEKELTRYRNREIGFIFQFHYLLKDFTALENVAIPGYMGGMSKRKAFQAARELISQVNLQERLEHYPHQLSGGERQRIALARSLINDPVLILADEPTGNLDERNSAVVEEILFSLVKNHQKTLILVTHDPELAAHQGKHFHFSGGALTEQ